MIVLISPSKDLDYKTKEAIESVELPRMLGGSKLLIEELKKKSTKKLMKLMDISESLADENLNRYRSFDDNFTPLNSKPSILAFSGEVYRGMDVRSLNTDQLNYCQTHVRILSGLYGLLRPMDLMQPYRLEMGTPLHVGRKKNLYHYWGDRITQLLMDDLAASDSQYLINLASKEYFQAIHLKLLNKPVINIHFREYKNDKLMFVSFTAKKARGLMVRYMAVTACSKIDELKGFNLENYRYEDTLSNESDWYFVR